MSVSDGEKVNAAVTNSRFVSRTVDSNTVGKVDYENTDALSGPSIINAQKQWNSFGSYVGAMINQVKDYLPTWASDVIGAANDAIKPRVEAIQSQVETNTSDISTNAAGVAANVSDIADIRTTTGTADGETDMGTYAGALLNDNESAKQNIQQLETQVEINDTGVLENAVDLGDLVTLSGVVINSTDLGTFTETIISDNVAVKVALQELETALSAVTDALDFQGLWNATSNDPTLSSGTGTKGHFYIVSTAGTTNLDGITDWNVGDWAIFDGTVWRQIDNTDAVSSVNGKTGVVVLDTDDISDAGASNKFATQDDLDKVGYITVTQPVNLDDIESDTATNTSKVSADGSIDTHSDVDVITVAPTDGQVLLFNTSTGKWEPEDSAGGGSGEGIVNYIPNPDAEIDLTDWRGYNDSPGVSPIDGIGTGGASVEIIDTLQTGDALLICTNVNDWFGTTFTTVNAGDLTDVSFKCYKASGTPTGNAFLEIYAVDGSGLPTGSVLGTSDAKPIASFSTSSTVYTDFTFSVKPALSAATQYAAVVNPSAITFSGLQIRFFTTTAGTYAGGTWIETGNGGTNWTKSAARDLDSTFTLDLAATPAAIVLTREIGAADLLSGVATFKSTKDAFDRQGSGHSIDCPIDPRYRNSILSINIDWKNDVNYVNSAYRLFVYDMDNSILIGPVSNDDNGYILSHTGDGTTFNGQFQTTDSLNYRFIIHNTSTDATAWTLNFDTVQMTPVKQLPSTAIESGTYDVASGDITPVTVGTVTAGIVDGTYIRNGGTVTITGRFTCSLGTANNHRYDIPFSKFPILSDYTVTKVDGIVNTNETGGDAGGFVVDGGTDVRIFLSDQNGTTARQVLFHFVAKIDAPDSNILSTNETNIQTIETLSGPQTPTGTLAAAFNKITFGTIEEDLSVLYDTSTGVWIAPRNGTIDIDLGMEVTFTSASGRFSACQIKNTVTNKVVRATENVEGTATGAQPQNSGSLKVSKGDTLEFQAWTNGAAAAFNSSWINTYFNIKYRPDFSSFGVTSQVFKTQTKYLTADITTNTTMADLTFSNLTVGQWYSIKGQFKMSLSLAGLDNLNVTAIHDGGNLHRIAFSEDAASQVPIMAFTIDFQASASSVNFDTSSVGLNSTVNGDSTTLESFITLSEIAGKQTTTEW